MHATTTALALAGALTTALAMTAAAATAQQNEQCFGVAPKGQNDCKTATHVCKGHSTIDYDGQSFKLVPKGTCVSMTTPHGPGSLTAIKRPS
jgi:uncharacterized membrane protein